MIQGIGRLDDVLAVARQVVGQREAGGEGGRPHRNDAGLDIQGAGPGFPGAVVARVRAAGQGAVPGIERTHLEVIPAPGVLVPAQAEGDGQLLIDGGVLQENTLALGVAPADDVVAVIEPLVDAGLEGPGDKTIVLAGGPGE